MENTNKNTQSPDEFKYSPQYFENYVHINERLLELYGQTPEKISLYRDSLKDICDSTEIARAELQKLNDSEMNPKDKENLDLKLKGLEKKAKCLLMRDLTGKLKKENGD